MIPSAQPAARHLVEVIAGTVDRFGDRPLIEGDRHRSMLTYRATWDWANDAAKRLERAGAGRGERVVIRAPKSVESLIAYLAALRLGAVWVPASPGATASELNYVIDDAEPRLVVDGTQAVADLVGEWPRNAPASSAEQPRSSSGSGPVDGSQTAALLYTSGTTGRPKGVPISGAALGANTAALVDAWAFTEADVLIHALPTHHAHGLFVALGCALASGASLRWVDRFDSGVVTGLLPGATAFMGVPTHYVRLLDEPGFNREACASVRLLTSGSAPLPAVTFDRLAERTGVEVVERYGMTETLMLTSNPLDGTRKPGSVGIPLPGVEVRLGPIGDAPTTTTTDPDTETAAAVGMVEVRGPSVFDHYRGHAADRTKPDHPGDATWFRTGDLGRWDEDGYLFLVGRSLDLIISGGLNVYPAEVEAVLERHPGVAEVAVIGLPDDHWGSQVAAIVVPTAAHPSFTALSDQLIEAARTELSAYKLPRSIHQAGALPRNAMGKVDKVALRQAYRAS